ncbi:hypothetical protein FACS189430_07270 [Bacteroidia bacterium]|nr:hypothetical protein FACS189430_07270 [Bacteroidia bacterium]
MKKYYIYLLLLLCSCSENNRIFEAENIIHIDVEKSDKEYARYASKLVKSVSYIPLQTTNDCLIGQITKLIYAKDLIYIYDIQSNKLYQFDKNGQFLRSIGAIGQGPGEYIRIQSFDVNQINGNISIYCQIKQSILEYTHDGNLVKVEKIGLVIGDFIYYENRYLFYCSWLPNNKVFHETYPLQYRLVGMSENIVTDKFLEYKYNDYLSNTIYAASYNVFYQTNENVMLYEQATNMVYSLNGNDAIATYAVDFIKYNTPFDVFSTEATKGKIDDLKNAKICRLSHFFETDSFIFIRFIYFENIYFNSIYFKESKKIINLGPIWINDIDNISMPNIEGTLSNNRLIGSFEAHSFYQMITHNTREVSQNLIDLSKSGDESDNPIICIIQF